MRAVREAIGPDVALTIDANGGWDEPTACACLVELATCRLTLVEQPLPRANRIGLKRLRDRTGQKVLVDEGCFDEVEARELLDQQCCDALSLYPGKQGGIDKARRIAAAAAERGIPCSIGSNLEWDVATAAMGHVVVALASMQVERYPGDVLGPSYHEFSIVKDPLVIEGPRVTVPAKPGLGVEVDWELARRHAVE